MLYMVSKGINSKFVTVLETIPTFFPSHVDGQICFVQKQLEEIYSVEVTSAGSGCQKQLSDI